MSNFEDMPKDVNIGQAKNLRNKLKAGEMFGIGRGRAIYGSW